MKLMWFSFTKSSSLFGDISDLIYILSTLSHGMYCRLTFQRSPLRSGLSAAYLRIKASKDIQHSGQDPFSCGNN